MQAFFKLICAKLGID